jgi:hypothetical protein
MVKFTYLDIPNPRLKPEMTKSFLRVGQLIGWELQRGNRTFSGLLIIGEKAIPGGFQTMADCNLDTSVGPQVPLETAKEIIQTVLAEYQKNSATVLVNPPPGKMPAHGTGKITGQIKVDPPVCGHKGGINVGTDLGTGKLVGKCALCGASANVELSFPES